LNEPLKGAPRPCRRHLRAHPRLSVAAGLGIAFGLLSPESWGTLARGLLAWDFAASIHLVLCWTMMLRDAGQRIRRRARLHDESRWVILLISAASSAVSLIAIVGLLAGFKDLADGAKPAHLALAIYTIICSWFFLHTIFTVHYAHEYYGSPGAGGAADGGAVPAMRRGLQFPGEAAAPGYIDFAYYAFTIGLTAQTSDTAVTTTAMRGLSLGHAVLTFFFNTVILAFSVNIAASLL
jgi:uncharacterized membrane protein